jgi:hypothetical protein
MKKNNVLIYMLFVFCSHLQSQTDSVYKKARLNYVSDSIKISKPKYIRPQLGFDNRKSFIRNSPVDITGYYAGIIVKNHFKFTLGYYRVNAEGRANKKLKDKAVVTIRDLELYYTTFNFEYLPVNKRFIKLGLPIDFGYGFSNLNIYSEDKTKTLYKSSGQFIPFSIGTELTLKPLRWIGLNGLVGYRKILKNSEPRIDFDGLFYSYGISIEVKEIIKDMRLFYAKKRFKKAMNIK